MSALVVVVAALILLVVYGLVCSADRWIERERTMANGLHCDDCKATHGGRPLWLWEGGALIARYYKLSLKYILCESCRSIRLNRMEQEQATRKLSEERKP